jgi:uncharacterized membrane protein YgaE (UPF0421/DUF939 family)
MDKINASPFTDSYRLGMFVMAAYGAPSAVQMAIVVGEMRWVIITSVVFFGIMLSPPLRWLLSNERWFRRSMAFNLAVQAGVVALAWVFGERRLTVIGVGIGFLLATVVSRPWQRRLREAHHISERIIS